MDSGAVGEEVELGRFLAGHVLEALKHHGFVEGIELEAKRGSSRGDNYMSVINKIKATGKTKTGEETNLFLLAKCIPTNQLWLRTFDVETHFRKEAAFYNEVLPSMYEFQKRHGVLDGVGSSQGGPVIFPLCYKAFSDGFDDFLLLEDLAEAGFRMKDRKDGVSLEESLLVVRSMGHFHALSYAAAEKEPEFLDRLKGVAFEAFFTGFNTFKYGRSFGQMVRSATEGVRKWCPESAECLDALLGRSVYERMVDLVDERDAFSVINFGDCWTNNLFFRDSQDGVPEEIRFIDFQLARFGSPMLDLSYFLFTSTEMSVREQFMEKLLEEYREAMLQTLARFSCDKIVTSQDLEAQMKRYAVFGLYMALILVPLYHIDRNDAPDVETEEDNALDVMVRFHLKVMEIKLVQQKVTSLVKQCAQFGYI